MKFPKMPWVADKHGSSSLSPDIHIIMEFYCISSASRLEVPKTGIYIT
jgi:hypothetical protein